MLQRVKQNSEKADTRIIVDGDTITVHHVTAHTSLSEGEGFQYVTKFDVSDLSEEEKGILMARTLIIAFRSKFAVRSNPNPETMDNLTIKASDLMRAERTKGKNRVEKAEKAFVNLTQDEIEALIKKYQK